MVETPFMEEISGTVITKLLDVKEQITLMIKLKFIRNRAMLRVTNGTQEKVTFNPTDMVGVVYIRSLGYYKVKEGMLQQNLSKQYHFESTNTICNQFNRLINMLKKEEEKKGKGYKYPWLDDSDERKHMTDREILDKYINLDKSSLTRREKKEVRELLYEYKDAFSLRGEIGMCPNIEVEIDITDKTPFFIRPFHTRGRQGHITQRNEKAMLFRNFKRGIFGLF